MDSFFFGYVFDNVLYLTLCFNQSHIVERKAVLHIHTQKKAFTPHSHLPPASQNTFFDVGRRETCSRPR